MKTSEPPLTGAFTARVEDQSIHGRKIGQGTDTFVLLTGLGVPALWWHELGGDEENVDGLLQNSPWQGRPFLAPALALFAQVISYDRAGIGESAPPQKARGLSDFLHELEAVLEAAEAVFPVVLVGHSLGGVIALEFARRFPERVAGLALLDSSHPGQLARFAAHAEAERLSAEIEDRRLMLERHPERSDLESLLGQGPLRAGELGDLPVIVISRSITADAECPADVTVENWRYMQTREAVWQQLQTELASLSARTRHIRLPRSGHYVHFDQPQEVAGAILSLLEPHSG